ncbi:MAG: hypothetical protein E7591_01530 [Ruminococcaceae bacterium]|nr:hypothetical protein [Oscillospiraceae bacterium]
MKKYIALISIFFVLSTFLTSCKIEDKPAVNSLDSAVLDNETDEANKIEDLMFDDVSVEFQNNNDYLPFGINDEMNELIKNYFVSYYKSLGSLEDHDMSDYFTKDSDYQACIVNEMISYQNGIRKNFTYDMQYKKASVGVTYRSLIELEDGYKIYLCENNAMSFNYIQNITSYTSDVEHYFTLIEEDGKYLLTEHSEISGVYELIKSSFDKYTSDLYDYNTEEIFGIVKDYFVSVTTKELDAVNKQREEYNSSPENYQTELYADNEYDVDAALEYSYEWAGKTEAKRNPNFGVYDIYGGNCNNFTSQCLFAGGIPMDLQGVQWKWYGESVNSNGGAYGRSPSWAECDYFYAYCTENEGYGLVCDYSSNIYSGRPGDLIQYIVDETDAVHTVIITKVIYDSDGNVVDYLINSNTTDKVDSPMSAYGYTNFRLIKIIGWNN